MNNSFIAPATVALLGSCHSGSAGLLPQWLCWAPATVALLGSCHSGSAKLLPQWLCWAPVTATISSKIFIYGNLSVPQHMG